MTPAPASATMRAFARPRLRPAEAAPTPSGAVQPEDVVGRPRPAEDVPKAGAAAAPPVVAGRAGTPPETGIPLPAGVGPAVVAGRAALRPVRGEVLAHGHAGDQAAGPQQPTDSSLKFSVMVESDVATLGIDPDGQIGLATHD
ncbi:hypothetical protein VR43_26455 [Streptomyces sp. NRRL S-104]|nr:hypothetical protein VR43_26455 [Streptomyces sp. NRRL S-104]